VSVEFSAAARKKFDEIVSQYPQRRAAMLPVLYLAEKEFGYVSPEVEVYVASLLDVAPVKVHEVMTFYTLFASKPRGKYHFQVCRGLSCDLGGCENILRHLSEKLGIKHGETSADFQFTLTEVECLASCETAPMMQLNDDYIDNLSPQKVDSLLNDIKKKK
jgi:NADH-quinone oxidoreductase subunit E